MKAIGLVHRTLPREQLWPAALDYVCDLAQHCSPLPMATAKRKVYADWERSLVESRRDARHLLGVLRQRTDDFREGVASFVERRAPSFAPLSEPVNSVDFEET